MPKSPERYKVTMDDVVEMYRYLPITRRQGERPLFSQIPVYVEYKRKVAESE